MNKVADLAEDGKVEYFKTIIQECIKAVSAGARNPVEFRNEMDVTDGVEGKGRSHHHENPAIPDF